ncbi:TPA: type I methionyl aminopeptidase [Candidatus Dependentiae bacterium]|nr:MAG: Methionine aminopeptidase [candidate division TM6 bacterium GW2011_GWF2_43_87]HBL98445.1 type I methionyl aminopeptidase [Candidatus Dependentiae bacterium]
MITIKSKHELSLMKCAGAHLAEIFCNLSSMVTPGATTLALDKWIEAELKKRQLISQSKGYRGYRHASCISINHELVHGIPSAHVTVREGDLVKIDICAAWKNYCADSARCFAVGVVSSDVRKLMETATNALNSGIEKTYAGKRLFDISAAVQTEVERAGFGVVRDFCGHGIGKHMHEEPEIPNYGHAGTGPELRVGMALAIEPMITQGDYRIAVASDGWTASTIDGSLAAHVEDTVIVTENGPEVITRL